MNLSEKMENQGWSEGGYVYCATVSGLFKIGSTRDLKSRKRELKYQTKQRVEIVDYVEVVDRGLIERRIHSCLDSFRAAGARGREWYELPDIALWYLAKAASVKETFSWLRDRLTMDDWDSICVGRS